MLTINGRSQNIAEPVVGRITTGATNDRSECILVAATSDDCAGYRGLITSAPITASEVPAICKVQDTSGFSNGDIVVMDRRGAVRTVYLRGSTHNTLFCTTRCNSNCLMCSQPPQDREDTREQLGINHALIDLIPTDAPTIGITGGEPTLIGADLIGLVGHLKARLPEMRIDLLTNGRRFANPEYTAELAEVRHPNLIIGVPLYSDSAILHDYIVQTRGAFDETMTGLHLLARWNIAVEIRTVLHRLTVSRLCEWADYVYHNLPFAVHVALMGLEPTGHARYNHDKLWIDPAEYQATLADAVEYLDIRGMTVSIYNLPRCLLPASLWPFARQSISDWKNTFLRVCTQCAQRQACAGFFESADERQVKGVQPVQH